MEYPYQIVTFFDKQPEQGESVYQGENGWYPQVALKRRFAFNGLSEEDGLQRIKGYCDQNNAFTIMFGQRLQPARMPVEVVEVVDSPAVIEFHREFIRKMGAAVVSKFPDREDGNYYPHMTVTWKGEDVVDTGDFVGQRRDVTKVWVLKDDGEDSRAFEVFDLAKG